MAVSAGILPRQPLFYVLASVRFQPWLALPKYIADIQDELRERFPLVNKVYLGPRVPAPAALDSDSGAVSWAFHQHDRVIGCHILQDQLIVHATQYTGFASFAEVVRLVLAAILRHSKILDCNTIGIRYLDLISPAKEESLSDYVPQDFLPFPHERLRGLDFKTIAGIKLTSYKTLAGLLQARFWTGQNMALVPEDLIPPYMLLTQDPAKEGGNFLPKLPLGDGILDTDSIWIDARTQRLTEEQIVSRLDELHSQASLFFRTVCSDHADKVWKRNS